MAQKDTEAALVQAPTAELLRDELGWHSVHAQNERFGPAGTLGRASDSGVVLERELLAAVRRLNPGLPEAAYTEAVKQACQVDATQTLIQTNEEKHRLLRDGVRVKVPDAQGRPTERRLRLIDFQNPANNHFLVVRELWVQGRLYRCRADAVGFVNGLPLVFIELKGFAVPLENAYRDNFQHYLSAVPQLFDWNALVILSNGHDAVYGSVTAALEHFCRWKRHDEADPEPAATEPRLPRLLRGLMAQPRLLDMVEHFIVFDTSSGSTQKIVARNHQVLGVNRVLARLTSTDPTTQAEVAAGRLGVFWHTQGSGKSYSMVFLTEKIRRQVSGRYSFVIVTDRNELDEQIATTYTQTGRANSQRDQAANSAALRSMLRDQNRHYVFGLIHKFREPVKQPYSERDDIIVISDEAHRTQYGTLAQNMRKGLPRAKFLGFTGTPLIEDAERQLTRQVFGDYVSVYDFQRAVADGATLPLFYEAHGEQLKIVDEGLNQRIAQCIEAARQEATPDDPWTQDKEDKLYRSLSRDYPLLTAPVRLEKVAQDFVEHYRQRWQAVEGGASKALLVCLDKLTCVRLFDWIQDKWQARITELQAELDADVAQQHARGRTPGERFQRRQAHLDWMRATEMCVVVSPEQNEGAEFKKWRNHRDEPLNITPHRQKMAQRKLEQEFKKPEHPFRVAIVCAMWLTGFDVKCLATLYLDKPLQGHTLMQAIARVNRVGGGKKHGLVVDYNGMLKSLRQALATFAQRETEPTGLPGGPEPVRDDAAALADYADSLGRARTLLAQAGFALAAQDALMQASGFARQAHVLNAADVLCRDAEQRKTFEVLVDDAQARHRALFPNPGLMAHADTHAALLAIRRKLQQARGTPDVSALLQALHDVVDDALDSQPPEHTAEPPARYDLSSVNFERLRAEFAQPAHPHLALLSLEEKIAQRLAAMLAVNPTRVDLYERYQTILAEYNRDKSAVEVQKVMDDLFALNDQLNEEDKRYLREGLADQEQLAVFDLLQRPNLTPAERAQVKTAAQAMLAALRQGQLQRAHWRANAVLQAQVRAEILQQLYAHLPQPTYAPQDISTRAGAVFTHLYATAAGAPAAVHWAH